MKRIPEFSGYRPKRYPGSQPPRNPKIVPRRPDPVNHIEVIKIWEDKFKKRETRDVTQPVNIFVLPVSPSYY